MKVLIIGGTGNLAKGILKHLVNRNAEIHLLHRNITSTVKNSEDFQHIIGDHNDASFLTNTIKEIKPDAVIDLICRNKTQAEILANACAGLVTQVILSSSVNTYGLEFQGKAIVPTDNQKPTFDEAKHLLEAEKVLFDFCIDKKFHLTIMRLSNVYGYNRLMPCNIQFRTVAWDRILNDLPIICCSDGLGLTHIAHIDDVGAGFAYAVLKEACFQKAYHLSHISCITWNMYYNRIYEGLGKEPKVIFVAKNRLIRLSNGKYDKSLNNILGKHHYYDSSSTYRDIPEFNPKIKLADGGAKCILAAKENGVLPKWDSDPAYNQIVEFLTKQV